MYVGQFCEPKENLQNQGSNMLDLRQTPQYADYLRKTGWIVESINKTNYFIRKIPILGAFLKIQRPESLRHEDIKILSEKHRAFQIIIEPLTINHQSLIIKSGYRLSKSPFLPTKTIQLDLTKSKEKIFKQIKKDARYSIRKIQKLKVKSQKLNDIEEFRNVWKKSVGLKRYVPSIKTLKALKSSFKEKSLFLLDEKENSGAIFLIGDKTGYYWQAFTSKEGRKSLSQYKIVWEGILWAKAQGAKIFDFEGIYDERFPNKSWLGFSHFKKSFGGSEIEYPGTYTKFSLFDTIRKR